MMMMMMMMMISVHAGGHKRSCCSCCSPLWVQPGLKCVMRILALCKTHSKTDAAAGLMSAAAQTCTGDLLVLAGNRHARHVRLAAGAWLLA
jgi:hypothetical protein